MRKVGIMLVLRIMVSNADDEGALFLNIVKNSEFCPSREQLLKANSDDLSWWENIEYGNNFWMLEAEEFARIFGRWPQDNRVYLMFLPNKQTIDSKEDLLNALLSGNEVAHWSEPASRLSRTIYNRCLRIED